MKITNNKTITEIQTEFNKIFPNLKIEFYKKPHEQGEGSPIKETLDSEQTIGDVRTNAHTGNLSISGEMKVATLEQKFEEGYGLHVQVMRRSGDVWIQTTSTDEWTLTSQDDRGKDSLRPENLII